MTNPPFPLLPWDKKLKKGAVRRADAVAQWNGKTYLLRAENGHLFFREADDGTRLWAVSVSLSGGGQVLSKVSVPNENQASFLRQLWSKITRSDEVAQVSEVVNVPDEDRLLNEENVPNQADTLISFWLEAVQNGNVARYLCYEFNGAFQRDFPIFLLENGTGFCREYWNRDIIKFQHPISRHDWLEGTTKNLHNQVDNFFWVEIAQSIEPLGFPDEINFSSDEEKIEWLCGSRDELQRVVEWICWLEPEFWEEDVAQAELDFETEGILSRAKLSLFEAGEKVGNYPLNYEAEEGLTEFEWGYDYQSERTKKWAPSEAFLPLIELALDYNTPAGEYWEYHDCCSGRASCSPWPIYLQIVVARPSAHEKIEAALQLEKWLQNKVSPREIEQLLRR